MPRHLGFRFRASPFEKCVLDARDVGSSQAAIYLNLVPLVALALGTAWLDEPVSWM